VCECEHIFYLVNVCTLEFMKIRVISFLCWVNRALCIVCVITNSKHCLFLVYSIKTTVHVSGISRPSSGGKMYVLYVANGTSWMTVSWPGLKGTDVAFHPG
jgi:hypothetical protein